MSLQKIKALLEKQTDGDLNFSFVDKAIKAAGDAEKLIGTALGTKLRGEIDGLKKFSRFVQEDLGFKVDGETNLRDFGTNMLDKIKKSEENGEQKTGLDKQIADLTKIVTRVQSDLKTSREDVANGVKKLASQKMRSRLVGALDKKLIPDAVGPLVDSLISSNGVGLAEDGDTVIFKKDGLEIAFDEGVTSFIKEKSALAINTQTPGGGASGGSGNTNQKTQSRSDFEQMTPKAQSEQMQAGLIKVVD